MKLFKFRNRRSEQPHQSRSRLARVFTWLCWSLKIGFGVWLYYYLAQILITAVILIGAWFFIPRIVRNRRSRSM